MSRIGLTPVPIPSGVDVSVSGSTVTAKGPKGELSIDLPAVLSIQVGEGEAVLARANEDNSSKALHGLNRSLVNNMVVGVSTGFSKDLEIVGVGYRANAKGKDKIEMSLGYSHTIMVHAAKGIEFEVPEPTKIKVIGIDKQAVGQAAAEIRDLRKPEPYKGKGVRYAGEHVIRKAGKAGK